MGSFLLLFLERRARRRKAIVKWRVDRLNERMEKKRPPTIRNVATIPTTNQGQMYLLPCVPNFHWHLQHQPNWTVGFLTVLNGTSGVGCVCCSWDRCSGASELGRLSLPDVPLWLVFEDLAQPIVLPGSATTSALHAEAARVHNVRSRAIGLGTPTNLPNPCPQPWNRSC